jgi:hypothetical protein
MVALWARGFLKLKTVSDTGSNLIRVQRRDLDRVALVECGYWPSTREAYSLSSSSAFSLTVFTGLIPLLSLSRSP